MAGVRTSSRIDPLGITAKVPLYQAKNGGWTSIVGEAKTKEGEPIPYASKAGKGNPSAVNHSNVTPDYNRYDNKDISGENRDTPDPLKRDGSNIAVNAIKVGGVTIDYALQSTVLSVPALRRLRFPINGNQTTEQNAAARTVLAALGLVAIAEQWQQGYFLRSRCDLVPEHSELIIERVVSSDVKDDDRFTLRPAEAIALLDAAVKEATEKHSLPWNVKEVELAPKPSLVAMVSKSRELELGEEGE